MIRFLSVALAVSLFAAPVFAAAPTGPVTIKAPEGAKQGSVTFSHAAHKGIACTKCHASAAGGQIAQVHVAAGAPLSANTAHKLCLDCHKADASKKAPTKCTDCHKKG